MMLVVPGLALMSQQGISTARYPAGVCTLRRGLRFWGDHPASLGGGWASRSGSRAGRCTRRRALAGLSRWFGVPDATEVTAYGGLISVSFIDPVRLTEKRSRIRVLCRSGTPAAPCQGLAHQAPRSACARSQSQWPPRLTRRARAGAPVIEVLGDRFPLTTPMFVSLAGQP